MRDRRPPKHLEDEGYGYVQAKRPTRKRRIDDNDEELEDQGRHRSPPRRRLVKSSGSRLGTPAEPEDVLSGDEVEEEEDEDESEEKEDDSEEEEEGGDHSEVTGRRSVEKFPSLGEIMAEAKEKGKQREDARTPAAGGEKDKGPNSGTSSGPRLKNKRPKGTKVKVPKRGAAGLQTSNSQLLQLQEKVRLQKELLAMQSNQYPSSTALVPFGIQQTHAPPQSLAAFQASAGAAGLMPAIQAMVAQAMQGALQGGHAGAAPTVLHPPSAANTAAPNKYNSPKTLKTIGRAVHAVFESGSPDGGFYTSIDPIANVTRVLLKVPKDDYDWSVGWVANHGELWQAASTKQMQQRSEVVKKVKHHLYAVYENLRKPKVDYNGFLADITPLQGDGFRVRLGDPFGDIRVKKVIGHVFLRNWNERVDELRVFIQQAAIVVAVIDIVLGNPAENRAPSDRLPNDGGMALHYEACLKKLQAEVDEFAAGTDYTFIRAPEPSLFMNGEDVTEPGVSPMSAQNSLSPSNSSVRPPLAPQPVNVVQPSNGRAPANSTCQPAAVDPQLLAKALAMIMSGAVN